MCEASDAVGLDDHEMNCTVQCTQSLHTETIARRKRRQ